MSKFYGKFIIKGVYLYVLFNKSIKKEKIMKNKIKDILNKIFSNKIVIWVLIGIGLTFFCDILNQRSFIEAFVRVFTKPLNFIFNSLIVMCTISLAGLFKKRKFAMILLCLPWVALSVGNFIVQCFRNTPVSFNDFTVLFSVFSVFNNYLGIFEIILIIVAISAIIAGLIILYRKEKVVNRLIKYSLFTFAIAISSIFIFRVPFIKIGSISNDYSNLTIAYEEYGLPYCFMVSVLDRGVDKPDDYNNKEVDEALAKIDELMKNKKYQLPSKITVDSDTKPNVIFLQLESFMDANNLINLNYTENPNPCFTYLKENYPSGTLTVPSFGAGTANVEFEIMTGLNLNYFGAGEYPYVSVMQDQTTETIGFLLKNKGYYNTIIHNNRASFYDRDVVFPNMGYDRYVSSEFMIDLEYTPVGWFKDKCLTYEIFKALENSKESDFIYTISVQPHGKYLTDLEGLDNISIYANSDNEEIDQETLNQFTYYVNQVKEVDIFLSELITKINNFNEPTMLVLYGDHLPNLDIENEDLITQDIYKSEYVIYTNYEYNLEDKDLYTYQLSSYILESIGCNDGIINQLHQTRDNNEEYYEMMNLLEYDIFEDEKHLWDGKNPYIKPEMLFGYNDTVITSVNNNSGTIIIKGENFTFSSKVYINNRKQDTTYVDKNTLLIHINEPKKDLTICVKQVYNNVVYTKSNEFILEKE